MGYDRWGRQGLASVAPRRRRFVVKRIPRYSGLPGAGAPVLAWRARQAASEARIKFLVTPFGHQCFCGVSRQVDGSFVTQVSGHFMVKNRTTSPLHLMTARLIRPRIKGEILPGLLTMQAIDSNMHGTAHVSGYFIPPQYTLPVSATILIRGVPKQKSGMMDATIEMTDADANKEWIRLKIKCINPELVSWAGAHSRRHLAHGGRVQTALVKLCPHPAIRCKGRLPRRTIQGR
jgi:hypothetical protein